MPPRTSSIPQYRERIALQSIKHRNWVPQAALQPAQEGTIATMLRKGWIERQLGPGGQPQFRITEAGKAAIAAKIPAKPIRALKSARGRLCLIKSTPVGVVFAVEPSETLAGILYFQTGEARSPAGCPRAMMETCLTSTPIF